MAQEKWYAAAFAGHPYARPANGTEQTVAKITRDDLEGLSQARLRQGHLKVVAVGDIDAAQLGALLDEVFGDLPEKADLTPVAKTESGHGRHARRSSR